MIPGTTHKWRLFRSTLTVVTTPLPPCVIQSYLVAEMDRCRITTVLPADSKFQILASCATFSHTDLNQLTDAFLVKRLES